MGKAQQPVSKLPIDYAKTDQAQCRMELFDELRQRADTAVRLGDVRRERNWILNERPQNKLLSGDLGIDDLKDEDFMPGLKQKAVDMRIGLNIASIALKKQASTIILVSGDADFVPASKLARREGVKIVLDPLWRSVAADLYKHIDRVQSGFPRPKAKNSYLPPTCPIALRCCARCKPSIRSRQMISTPAAITIAAPSNIVPVGTSAKMKYPMPSANIIDV